VEIHEGEAIDNLAYEEITKIELHLLKLLSKVRKNISKV
jgi:hypothetical protein